MTIGTFYNPFADTQDRPPVTHCHRCGGEIYSEDDCYLSGSEVVCEQCGNNESSGRLTTGRVLDEYFKTLYGG